MKAQNARRIEEELARAPRLDPPADLLERIRAEIPEELTPAAGTPKPGSWRRWPLAAAASLFVAVIAGWLGYRLAKEGPTLGEVALSGRQEAVAPAPPRLETPDAVPSPTSPGVQTAGSEGQTVPPSGQSAEVGEEPASGDRSRTVDLLVEGEARPPEAEVGAAERTKPEPSAAQSAPPEPSGLQLQVVDVTGAPLPGATVTVRGAGAPRVELSDTGGVAAFPDLGPGSYDVITELDGHATVELPQVTIQGDTSPSLQITLSEAAEQVITIHSESPLLDEHQVLGRIDPERVSTAKDPWSALQRTPGVQVDRVNVGGQEAGPARLYAAPGAAAPSTGGTTEPNDAPYGDMFFGSYGVNPFIDTEDDRLSTFGLDVDTGSYTLVRSYLERGNLPPADAVRVEEFVNSFDYGDPAPRRGDFSLTVEGAPTPFGENDRYALLRFGLQARGVERRDRRPTLLVFTVDVSGSMAREDRLELVKRSLELLIDELEPEDEVGLVTYDESARIVLEPSRDRWALRRAVERLVPGGSTNAEAGLVLAYDLIGRSYREGFDHRIILCSDGVANVGRTGPDSILERIGREAARGIELTAVGVGMGNYNDLLLEQLADRGNGRYAYVDTLEEAERIFVEELTGTLHTVAYDAKVQVEFDPAAVARYRLLGYENRDVADRDFRNDRVDAGEVGAEDGVVALYEVKLTDEARPGDRLATLRLRYRRAGEERVVETAADLRLSDLAPGWDRAPAALRLAGTVAEFSELLKGSYWAREGSLAAVLREARRLEREEGSEAVAELVRLIEQAERLGGRRPEPASFEDE